MKRKTLLRTAAVATAAAVIAVSAGALIPAYADSSHQQGHGRYSSGMGHGAKGMGSGMMSRMMMHKMMGGGIMGGMMGSHTVSADMTAARMKEVVEGMLAWHGNERLKVGKAVDAADNKITVEILTVDDSLVKRLEFNRKSPDDENSQTYRKKKTH